METENTIDNIDGQDSPHALNSLKARLRKLKFKRALKLSLLILGLVYISHAAWFMADGLNDDQTISGVIVIFGTKINPDGQPSNLLKMRLNKGLELYQEGYGAKIIVSGGVGEEGFSEATVMKKYLVEKGVPNEEIMLDENGTDTYHTAKNSSELMAGEDFESALLVTDYYHAPRAKLAFKKSGIDDVEAVHADYLYYKDVYAIGREILAYYAYMFRDY